MGPRPRHLDDLETLSGLPLAELQTALLTLTLENVVEEGPLGFFSRTGK
jgi:predicted Rossmann fold nucleotide-binding protein DprA/Smf involved in DNA uptake